MQEIHVTSLYIIWRKYINIYFNNHNKMSQDFALEQLQLFTSMTTNVTILPSFNDDGLYLLSGQIPNFKANHQTDVPFWLALLLKKQQKCKIIPPFWMKQSTLNTLYSDQCSTAQLINLQNPSFFQISYMILNNAADDVVNPTKIRNYIDSLKDVRQKNILKKMKYKNGFVINNATTYQLNKFRKANSIVMQGLEALNQIKSNPQ